MGSSARITSGFCISTRAMAQALLLAARKVHHSAKTACPPRDEFERVHRLVYIDARDGNAAHRCASTSSEAATKRVCNAVSEAIMQKPEVILADEPIASLDRALADEIISLLTRVGSGRQADADRRASQG